MTFELVAFGWAALAFTGCSQEEALVPDPGASPFYPGTAETTKGATAAGGAAGTAAAPAGVTPVPDDTLLPRVAGAEPIDARFGTNEVERQLRIALRTAQKGDRAAAAEMLDKVLAVEPINREALRARAMIFVDQARQLKSPDEKIAAIDKAVAMIAALRRAYDSPKPHEKELISRVLYARFKILAELGRVPEAVAALDAACESGIDGYAGVDLDESMAKLRATSEYKQAHQADDDRRLARARERTQGKLAPPPVIPLAFTLPDLTGKKTSLADFKGKVVLIDFWGTWCGPCREAIPFLIKLYNREHARGLEIVGLNYERDATSESQHMDMAKKFVEGAKIPYTCLLGDDSTVRQIPGFKGFPTAVVVDRAGKVRLLVTENDADTPELIDDTIRILLAEPAPKPETAPKKP